MTWVVAVLIAMDALQAYLLVSHFAFVNNGADINMAVRSTLNRLPVLVDLIHLFLDIPLIEMW